MNARCARTFLFSTIVFVIPHIAAATSISGVATSDDTFTAYLSTDDSVLGTLYCSQPGSWMTATTCGAATLTADVTNFLHIVASDQFGAPSMLIGTFDLSDDGFFFANGAQSLSTDGSHWVVRASGFGDVNLFPEEIGPNGTAPWGTFGAIDANAQYIWDVAGGCDFCTRYFSTPIFAGNSTQPPDTSVPEPGTLTLLGMGIAVTIRRLRRQ